MADPGPLPTPGPLDAAGPLVSAGPLDTAALRASVLASTAGALVEFRGIVRDHDGGRGVLALDYQAHPSAQRELERCCAEQSAASGIRVIAAHRTGSLQVGELALYAAAAAAHRAEAFEACERLVEQIKREVPIWKRQHFADGSSEWVGL